MGGNGFWKANLFVQLGAVGCLMGSYLVLVAVLLGLTVVDMISPLAIDIGVIGLLFIGIGVGTVIEGRRERKNAPEKPAPGRSFYLSSAESRSRWALRLGGFGLAAVACGVVAGIARSDGWVLTVGLAALTGLYLGGVAAYLWTTGRRRRQLAEG